MKKLILISVFLLAGCSQEDTALNGEKLFLQGNYEDAIRILEPLANSGDPSAQFYVGKAYSLGLFVDIDEEKARDYYTKASPYDVRAKINLANMLYSNGSERYKRKAMLMFEEVIDQNVIAYLNYHINKIREVQDKSDVNQIISEIEKEATLGDDGAIYTLGWFNLYGLSHQDIGQVMQRDQISSKFYLEKIKSKDEALDLLLIIYLADEKSNFNELLKIANRLSDLGYANSKQILGSWYVLGDDFDKRIPVKRDIKLGREYLFQAAELRSNNPLDLLTNNLDANIDEDIFRFRKISERNGDYIKAAYSYYLGPVNFIDQNKQALEFLNSEINQKDNPRQKEIWLQASIAKSLYITGQKEEAYKLANRLLKSIEKEDIMVLPNIYYVICNQDIENQNLKEADKSCLAGDFVDTFPRPFNIDPLKDSRFFASISGFDPITANSLQNMLGLHSLVTLSMNNASAASINDDIERLLALEKILSPPSSSLTQISISRLYSAIRNQNEGIFWGQKGVSSDPNSSYAKQVTIQAFLSRGSASDIDNAMRIAHDLARSEASNSSSSEAKQHIAWAQGLIGSNYYTGEYLEKDLEQAKYWLTKASDNGSTVATGNLGILHLWTEEYKDINKAEELFIEAINKEENYFEASLGEMYVLGLSGSEILRTKENYDEGLEMLNNYITANDKNFDRLFAGYFADSFYEGAINEKEPFCKLVRYSAENKDAIGLLFKAATHFDKDCIFKSYIDALALKDLEKAYKLRSNSAALLLGNIYRDGEYATENFGLAEYYYDKAEELLRDRREDDFTSLLLNSYLLEEIDIERLELNSKIRIAEAEKRKESERVASLQRERERRSAAERKKKERSSETPFLDFLGGVLKVAAVVAAADFVIDNADVIAEALAESSTQDYDWDWDYFKSNGQWRCRGIQTGRFADNSNCLWDLKDDDRWPYN